MIKSLFKKGIYGIFFFFAVSPAWALETVLQYSLTETHTPSVFAQAKKKEKEIHLTSKKEVVLGDGFFSVKEGRQERIYDFKKRRIHYLDHQTKTRTEISLFADPAFRVGEFQHRINMDEVIQKAGGQALEDPFTLESIFGIESQSKQIGLKEDVSEKGKIKFLSQDKIISEITWSENKASPEGEMFARFLIYDNSLHPLVRKKIAASGQIPDVIRNQLQSADGTDQFVLILDAFKTRSDKGFQIPDYAFSKKKPGAGPLTDSLSQLIQSVQSGKSKITKHDKKWFIEHAHQAAEDKKYLDAALSILEYGLQTGDQETSSAEVRKLADHQKDDTELDRFFRSLGIAGPEQAKRAVVELGKINRKNLSRGHVIDIMIANQQSVLEHYAEAQKRMLGALKMNPYIAGAYKDLGDMFYAEFDMVSAWLCWDFAREQTPGHFMLKPISDYEAQLLKDYPDFF